MYEVGKGKPPKEHQFKPGQSGNPKGLPKGTKHLSTWIQEMLNEEISFKIKSDPKGELEEFKGVPIKAIIAVAIHRAMLGDKDAREWLARHGYGTQLVLNIGDPVNAALEKLGLIGGNDAGQTPDTAEETPKSIS